MSDRVIERLCEAIGYPDRIPGGARVATLRVDGMDITAEVINDRLVLKYALTDDEGMFARLGAFAAGRILKEAAVLAAERPDAGGLFVWQDIASNASAHELRRLFETFCSSCDWWRERIASLSDGGEASSFGPEQMLIRP